MAEIRVLSPEDVRAYGDLRLQALETEPFAFCSSPEDRLALTPDALAARLVCHEEGDFTLGAFEGDAMVGTVGFGRATRPKLRHLGGVVAMYVAPELRGQGVGRALMTTLIERTRSYDGLLRLGLSVTGEPARSLYRSLGFVTWGVEPQGIKVGDVILEMEHMSLDLRSA